MFKTKLIFQLSFLGLLMGLATTWFIPYKAEPYFWLVVFFYCAYRIGKIHRGNYFLHGVFVSIVCSIWYTLVHIFFFRDYIMLHPEELSMLKQMSLTDSPKAAILITGPVFGAIFGILLGTLSVIASQIIAKNKKRKTVSK
jgi:hypothetical protein